MSNIRATSLFKRIYHLQRHSNLLSKPICLTVSTPKHELQQKRTFSYKTKQQSFNKFDLTYGALAATLLSGLVIYKISTNHHYAKTEEIQVEASQAENFNGELETNSIIAEKSNPVASEPESVAIVETSEAVASEPESVTIVATENPGEVSEPVSPVLSETETLVVTETVVPVEAEIARKQDEEKFLPEIPNHAQYLIIGGGTAAMAAFKAIRANDENAKVLVVTEEAYKPYMRPPLSKDLWLTEDEKLVSELRFKQYNGNERSLFFLDDEFYVTPKYLNEQENGGVAVVTGRRVTQVDAQKKTVKLDNSWEISFDKCLIATGGRPRNLTIFEKSEQFKDKVTLFRNIDDFKNLHHIAKQGKTIAVVGGGFLGSELACALASVSKRYGGKVVQVYPESGNLRKILPEYLSNWTTRKIVEEGVKIIPNASIERAQLNDNKVELSLSPSSKNVSVDSPWLLADHVVVAVGLDANVQLAESGLEIDPHLGGYVVNAELQARNSIWVAGDAACFYDIKLGRRRVEHHDHAVVSGRLAGENMTGANKPYWHQSMFWSDLGPKIGFEAIGLVDSSLQTVGLFAKADENDTPQALSNQSNETRPEIKETNSKSEPVSVEPRKPFSHDEFGKGVVLYLKNDILVGVLLWNVFTKVPIARRLIQSQEKIKDYADIASLFKINATGMEQD